MKPFPAWVHRLWSAWDIRVTVLWSLFLQIVLIFCGARRKTIRAIWIEVVVWSSYLMADWVAVFALSKLSNTAMEEISCENNKVPCNALMVLWVPLLLLHLGGPDTITAYSVEDVHLWLRHTLGFISYVGLAIYAFLGFWTGNTLWPTILAFALFIAGGIKYGERSWVLWCTNEVYPQVLLPIRIDNAHHLVNYLGWNACSDAMMLVLSYVWLKALVPCLAETGKLDERLTPAKVTNILWDMTNGVETSFKFFELQLGFMYDALYTKASNIFTTVGCAFRILSSICVVSVLLVFILISKDEYSSIDVYITYTLLAIAAALEIYAIMLVIYSNWTVVWMSKHANKPPMMWILRFLAPLVVNCRKRWASSVPRLNLLCVSLYAGNSTILRWIPKYFEMDQKFITFMCCKEEGDLNGVKTLIMEEVIVLFEHFSIDVNYDNFFSQRGELLLERLELDNKGRDLWCISGKSFEVSIVIWHFVTNYCYYLDNNSNVGQLREISMIMSDYMMHLLVNQHHMLGNVVKCNLGSILGCFGELMDDITKEGLSNDNIEVCKRMLVWEPSVCTSTNAHLEAPYSREYGRMPLDASELAETLMGNEYNGKKWDIIGHVWVEMLFHGASKCSLTTHLKQLRHGGELLSQVWLLLTIHGLISPSPYKSLRPMFAETLQKIDKTSLQQI
ncbi:hypothetical protein LguiA_007385 [Lonicera macranthoides]